MGGGGRKEENERERKSRTTNDIGLYSKHNGREANLEPVLKTYLALNLLKERVRSDLKRLKNWLLELTVTIIFRVASVGKSTSPGIR